MKKTNGEHVALFFEELQILKKKMKLNIGDALNIIFVLNFIL